MKTQEYGFKFFDISENTEVFEDLHKDFEKILNNL